MPACPEGHDTPSTDFCDVCGIRVGAQAQAQAGAAVGACPRCGADRSGQFCEACGYSFAAGVLRKEALRHRQRPDTAMTTSGSGASGKRRRSGK